MFRFNFDNRIWTELSKIFEISAITSFSLPLLSTALDWLIDDVTLNELINNIADLSIEGAEVAPVAKALILANSSFACGSLWASHMGFFNRRALGFCAYTAVANLWIALQAAENSDLDDVLSISGGMMGFIYLYLKCAAWLISNCDTQNHDEPTSNLSNTV